MPKYLVKSPLKMDGKTFKPGDQVELSEKEAPAILAVGTIEPVDLDETGSKKKKG